MLENVLFKLLQWCFTQ